jgi:hypothetical protein
VKQAIQACKADVGMRKKTISNLNGGMQLDYGHSSKKCRLFLVLVQAKGCNKA